MVPKSSAFKTYPTTVDQCWRGFQVGATFMHIWWNCPWIVSFWRMVQKDILKLMGVRLVLHPRIFLLLDFDYFHIQ